MFFYPVFFFCQRLHVDTRVIYFLKLSLCHSFAEQSDNSTTKRILPGMGWNSDAWGELRDLAQVFIEDEVPSFFVAGSKPEEQDRTCTAASSPLIRPYNFRKICFCAQDGLETSECHFK